MWKLIALFIVCLSTVGCAITEVMPGSSKLPEERLTNKLVGSYAPGKLYVGQKTGFYHTLANGKLLVKDNYTEAYANKILNKLKRASNVKNIPGKVYFNARKYLDAEATPNGNIYIDFGAFGALDNEDQFASLLAHELAHVILSHHNSDVYLKYHRNAVRMSSIVSQMKNQVEKLVDSKDKNDELTVVKKLTDSFLVSDGLVFPVWNRSQELEADLLAYELLAKANYSVNALGYLFEKLEANAELVRKDEDIKARNRLIAAQKEGVMSLISEAGKALRNRFGTIIARKHPPAKVREEYLSNYTSQFELDPEAPDMKKVSWNRVKNRTSTQSILKSLDTLATTSSLINTLDLLGAEKMFKTPGLASSQLFMRFKKAHLRYAQRDVKKAKYNYTVAGKSQYAPFSVHLKNYELSKRSNRDFNALYNQFIKYQKPPNYFAPLIKHAKQSKKVKLAGKLEKECVDKYTLEAYSCIFPDDENSDISFSKYLKKLSS